LSSLSLSRIEKQLGGNPILRGIDLEVEDGELVVLVGPSGCGKSTLLRTIAGLEIPDAGQVKIGTRDVTRLPPRERDVAMVFQSYALYPHLTVRENLSFGLKLRKTPAAAIAERVQEVASMLGLEELLDRYPRQMSGGQRQRVAMGRSIARRPALFLFDEPLSNLDSALRAEVRIEIKRLHGELASTMIYVTHDQVEAMTLADRLVVLNAGKVEQCGPPLDVYDHPANRFVAAFMGSPAMNFLSAEVSGGEVRAKGLHIAARESLDEGPVIVGIRPQDVERVDGPARSAPYPENGQEAGRIDFVVDVLEPMGFEAYAHGRVGDASFIARLEGDAVRDLSPGDAIQLAISPRKLHLFDPETERVL